MGVFMPAVGVFVFFVVMLVDVIVSAVVVFMVMLMGVIMFVVVFVDVIMFAVVVFVVMLVGVIVPVVIGFVVIVSAVGVFVGAVFIGGEVIGPAVYVYHRMGSGDASPFIGKKLQAPSRKAQFLQFPAQGIGVNPQIHQGAQGHIAGNSGKTIKM
jgi:hypothetical protein